MVIDYTIDCQSDDEGLRSDIACIEHLRVRASGLFLIGHGFKFASHEIVYFNLHIGGRNQIIGSGSFLSMATKNSRVSISIKNTFQ